MAKKSKKMSIEEEIGFVPASEQELGFVEDTPTSVSETISDIAVTAPQGITTWADELQAAGSAILQAGGGRRKPVEDIYSEEIGPIRQKISEARERSPMATFAGEVATGIGSAFLPVLGAGKLATSAGGMIARGALEGLGTAEDKASMEGLTQAGIGAGMGGLSAGMSGVLKKATTVEPNVLRANVLGARTVEMKEVGRRSREVIAKKMKDLGMFSPNKVKFDIKEEKFIPVSKLRSLESLEKPTQDKLLQRAESAIDDIQEEKMKLLGNYVSKPIDVEDLTSTLDEAAKEWSKKGSGIAERYTQASGLKDIIVNDILSQVKDANVPTIGDLELAKIRLGKDTKNWGSNALVKNIPDIDDLYMTMYSTINKKLRGMIPDPKYSKFNDMQSDFLTVATDLTKAIASSNVTKPTFRSEGLMSRAMSALGSGEETTLGAANLAEFLQGPMASKAVTGARVLTQESPYAGIRYLDPSIPLLRDRVREPQSVGFTPRQLINYKIPRSTQGILEQKDKVIAKLAQEGAPSEMIDTVAQALNGDPEDVSNLAPVLLMQLPQLFEKSKYKVFDGKFLDPNDKAKAADDISKREDLDSIQRARMINRINKFGEVPEGL
jgi:hypothetical protein